MKPLLPKGEERNMADWIIESRDEITQRTGRDRRDTEEGFRTLVKDILSNPRRKLISVTLPNGEVLDEAAVRALPGFTIGVSPIGQTPIG
jgi:hypothetical protein